MTKGLIEKLLFVESQCINHQDALIIRLLLEGLEVHEIVYLKKDSLDMTNKILTVKDASGVKSRFVVSSRCAMLFKRAINQSHYFIDNGSNQSELRESKYAIKVTMNDYLANESMIQEMDSVVLRTIYNRIRNLAERFNMPEITYVTTVRVESDNRIYA
ncbi:phage lytic cycle repressor MrpR family protein [Paenibacillus eucommiae]|uniref:Site-specific recombinase XerD n=1 Tax=Paenibacillus eucommiae TaxID=1355755 RepID=A0ABS4IR33_9BACL|nr:hypothetical protein [Paenibacillus eucommiae]MBP1990033.1 site-specific recombinase XerD [Paenibacillus eucommiae]